MCYNRDDISTGIIRMGKVILVCSGSGGAGKTTFAVNLSVALAAKGKRVLLFDINVGRRNADIYLGMEDRILFDLGDVMSGLCSIDKAIIPYDLCEGLYILACPQYREIEGFGPGHVRALTDVLKRRFDYVITDCPVSIGGTLRTFSAGADAALILTVQDHASVRNADALSEKLACLGVEKRFFAINRIDRQYSGSESIPSVNYIARTITVPLVGMVTEDPSINIANNTGFPVAMDPSCDMARRFSAMADRLTV